MEHSRSGFEKEGSCKANQRVRKGGFIMDLTIGQKIGIGFIILVFITAGVYLYYGLKPAPDMTISSWIENHPVGVDQTRKIGPTNPIDVKSSTRVRIFACFDGKLYVTEFNPESGNKYSFSFHPDSRHKSYVLYQDPWTRLESISDPYLKTISFAAYADAEGNRLGGGGVLRRAKLTSDQLDAELIARKKMEADVSLIDHGCELGTFKPEIYQKVVAAYTAYVAQSGDPTKDAAKAILAMKFLKVAVEYLQLMDKDKAIAIDKYIADIGSILTQDQKKIIGDNVRLAVRPRPLPPPVLAG